MRFHAAAIAALVALAACGGASALVDPDADAGQPKPDVRPEPAYPKLQNGIDLNTGLPAARIVGGVTVDPAGKYPFIVRLQVNCAGSLIHPEWVLTAKHCMIERENVADHGPLFVNRHFIDAGGISVVVTEALQHPRHESDVGLFHISPPVYNITPIALDAGTGPYAQGGEMNSVIGWGLEDEYGNQLPTELREIQDLPVITHNACRYFGNMPVFVEELCIGGEEGRDACNGDSGGPSFWQEDGKFVQTGVVSWGEGCGRFGKYGVYARVSSALEWIQEYVPDVIVAH